MTASSVSPATYSITMKKMLYCFSAVRMETMFGWFRRSEQARLSKQIAEVDVLPMRNLDGDLLVDPGVFGEVNRAESAAAQEATGFCTFRRSGHGKTLVGVYRLRPT